MKTNEYIEHKANKLGVEINHKKTVLFIEDGEIDCWYFQFGGHTYETFSLRELENQLDDLLDPMFRQAEAEADKRFLDRAYGE